MTDDCSVCVETSVIYKKHDKLLPAVKKNGVKEVRPRLDDLNA